MLMNFCDPRLRPEVYCDTITTDGYEVINLINDSSKGFLAYSCVRPPVNIDFTFVCNIQIKYILIWPSIGSQKSSGFQLYAKSTNDANTPYTLLSTGYLNPCDDGILFYPLNIDHKNILTPPNFLKRYIKTSLLPVMTYTNSLRINICKTQNSVPALHKIEVWGTVSPSCGKDVVASVHTLWFKHSDILSISPGNTESAHFADHATDNVKKSPKALDIPDNFLDAITYEIMTQPIVLPSGNIVDQTTLQKHEQTEALWGRNPSDPFTGIPFSEHRKPVIATVLKTRIDKFLLENCDADEVKNLPRVLGGRLSFTVKRERTCISNHPSVGSSTKSNTRKINMRTNQSIARNDSKKRKTSHQLPVVECPIQPTINIIKGVKKANILDLSNSDETDKQGDAEDENTVATNTDSKLDCDVQTLLSKLKRFDKPETNNMDIVENSCNCCDNSIFYRLPCKHTICRKVLISAEQCKCKFCGTYYKKSEIMRIHT